MENQPITNSFETTPIGSKPISQSPIVTQIKTNLLVPILSTLLVSALVFGLGGYYFGTQRNSSISLSPNTQTSCSPQPTMIPSTPPVPTEVPEVSEMGNTEMKRTTRTVSANGKYQVWLDGKNYNATQLWTSTVNVSQKKLLVTGTTLSPQTAKLGEYSLASPIWSPDATQIAYFRVVISDIGELDVSSQLDLYIINQDGTNDHLVKTNIITAMGGYGKTDLSWTSQGISYTDYSSAAEIKTTIQPK